MNDLSSSCALFDTAVGRCGIAWSATAITAFQLPEASDAGTLRRMSGSGSLLPQAEPPAWVQDVIDRVVALLRGERVDLRDVPLDFDAIAPFERRVYEASRQILAGHTRTYGELATALGEPVTASRAVGRALGANPFAVIVPCHRVLAAGGKAGGFSAGGGVTTKLKILLIEQAQIGNEPSLF
jgi:methylated-DNA-[protein]-cysteine S-methyltransferase